MYVFCNIHHVHASCLCRPNEGARCPGTGVRLLWAAVWVLVTESLPHTKAATATISWAVSPEVCTLKTGILGSFTPITSSSWFTSFYVSHLTKKYLKCLLNEKVILTFWVFIPVCWPMSWSVLTVNLTQPQRAHTDQLACGYVLGAGGSLDWLMLRAQLTAYDSIHWLCEKSS